MAHYLNKLKAHFDPRNRRNRDTVRIKGRLKAPNPNSTKSPFIEAESHTPNDLNVRCMTVWLDGDLHHNNSLSLCSSRLF